MRNLRSITRRHLMMTSASDGGEGGGAGGAAGAGGAGAGAEGGAAGGADGGAAAAYYEAFTSADLKTHPSIHRYKTVEDLAQGYVNLEKRYGVDPSRRLDLPVNAEDKDGWRAVWTKLGAPEKEDGYGLQLADGATDADKAMLADFTKAAFEAGVPKGHAEAMMKFWMGKVEAAQAAQAQAFEDHRKAGEAELRQEWGQAYDQRTREIGRLIEQYADDGLKAELNTDKLGNYPNLARMLGKMLDRMAEPGAAGGQSGDADTGARALTPSQAMAEARKLEGHPALRDRTHPEHAATVKRRNELLAMAQPSA